LLLYFKQIHDDDDDDSVDYTLFTGLALRVSLFT